MATAGPTIVGTGTDAGGGVLAWTSPGNITANDGVFASATSAAVNQNTNFLNGTMGASAFSIPTGSTVNGIQAGVSRKDVAGGGFDIVEGQVWALKAGTRVGTNQTVSNFVPSVLTLITYGSTSNLWGTTWTSADINNTGFGAAFQWSIGTNGNTIDVDYYQLTVTYTPPTSKGMMQFMTQYYRKGMELIKLWGSVPPSLGADEPLIIPAFSVEDAIRRGLLFRAA